MIVFRKTCRALFSCYLRYKKRFFALLPTNYDQSKTVGAYLKLWGFKNSSDQEKETRGRMFTS